MLSEFSALFFKRFLLFRSLAHSLSNHVTDFELLTLTLGTYSSIDLLKVFIHIDKASSIFVASITLSSRLEVLIFISMSDQFTIL